MTPRVRLAFLGAGHFCCHYFLLIFPTAVLAVEAQWSVGYSGALRLGTPLYACFALATLPAGWIGDRLDGDWMIGAFFLGCGSAAILIGLSANAVWLMAGLGALGMFAAIYHPVGLSLVTRVSPRPGRALAWNGVFGNLGLAAASLVTGLLADRFGWRSAFLVPGIVALGLGAVLFYLRSHSPRFPDSGASGRLDDGVGATRCVQVRVTALVLVSALFSGFVFNGVSISLPKLLSERLDGIGGLSAVGGTSAAVFAVAAFAQLPVGVLLDRVGGRPVLVTLALLEAGALAVTARADGVAVVPAALLSVTLMFASIPITAWLLGRYVAACRRSRALAAEYLLSLGMGSVIVPVMAALYGAGYGFDRQYLLFSCSAVVVAAGALAVPKTPRSEAMPPHCGATRRGLRLRAGVRRSR